MTRIRGFTLLEMTMVIAVFAILSAVALPTATAISKRRAEVEVTGNTGTVLHRARDTAYNKLTCVGVEVNTTGVITESAPCNVDAGPGTVIDNIAVDPSIVASVSVSGAGELVFQPNGGLPVGTPPRLVHLRMQSGRETWFEIQPAIGTITECKSVSGTTCNK